MAFRVARLAAIVAALLIVLSGTAAAATLPSSMSATGDSITRAYNTGYFPFTDAPQNSWSTGTNTTVNSQYQRILALNGAIRGKNYNDAKSGAKMTDLDGQMKVVASRGVGYVTVLMGGNDVCTSTEAAMTPVDTFTTQFRTAMTTITTLSPNTQVFVASIPNAYRLWSILKDNASARAAWSFYKICQSLLANPLSTAQADVDRRTRVQQRNADLNAQLALICGQFAKCQYDGGAVYNTAFVPTDISTRDYFHPSISGQAKLAAVTWSARVWP